MKARSRKLQHSSGFSLIELLVVIAVIAILAALLLPALHKAKASSLSLACRNNQRQLQLCFAEYVNEFGQYPPNNLVVVIGYGSILGDSWAPGDVDTDTGTNTLQMGALYPYGKNLGIYRCPADRVTVPAADGGSPVPRVRGYKMSQWFNCISEPYGYQRESALISQGVSPSDTFVFIDMHSEGFHDPAFGIYIKPSSYRDSWVDLPSDRHSQGVNLSFLDGHVEPHRWQAPKKFISSPQTASPGNDKADLRWLQRYVPPRSDQSF